MVVHQTQCTDGEADRRPKLEVADILRAHGRAYLMHHPTSAEQRKVLAAIETCRTAVLGGHVDECDHCGFSQVSYNSCRNRHCPKCQGLAQAHWVEQRKGRILPVAHFHVVFTLPQELRPLAYSNPGPVYDLLLSAAARTLLAFGRDPRHLGAQLGVTAVLHTWNRDLSYHPHVHCIVTGGGLSLDGERWISKKGRFLFPVRALGEVFRGKFLEGLGALFKKGSLLLSRRLAKLSEPCAFEVFQKLLYQKKWVVYAKRPFGGAEQVFGYLGRYTHRVGLSNHRLLRIDAEGICFKTRHGNTCTLTPTEFIRRFLLHVLPSGFVKIRHFGLLSSTGVRTRLPIAQRLLETTVASPSTPAPAVPPSAPAVLTPAPPTPDIGDKLQALTGMDLSACPRCEQGRMVRRPLVPLRNAAPHLSSAGDQAFADSS